MQPTVTTHIVLGGSRQEPHKEYASSNGEAKICKDACIEDHPLPLAQTGNFFNWSGFWVAYSAVPTCMTLEPLVFLMSHTLVIRFGIRCTRRIFPECP